VKSGTASLGKKTLCDGVKLEPDVWHRFVYWIVSMREHADWL